MIERSMRHLVVGHLKAFIEKHRRAPSCVQLSPKVIEELNEELAWDKRELLRIAKVNKVNFSEGEKIDFPELVGRGTSLFGAIVLEAKDENTPIVFK
jgi:hypothetical protein